MRQQKQLSSEFQAEEFGKVTNKMFISPWRVYFISRKATVISTITSTSSCSIQMCWFQGLCVVLNGSLALPEILQLKGDTINEFSYTCMFLLWEVKMIFFFMSWHQFTTRRQQIPKKVNVWLRSLMGNSWLMLTHRNELKVFCLRSYITLLYQVDTENDALSEMSTVKCGQKHIFDSLNVWSALPFLRAILCSLEVYQSLLMSQNFSDTTTEDNILIL